MKKIHESKNSKKFNATINKVHEEMEYAEKVASGWRVNWDETYSQAYCYDLQYLIEDEIAWLESMYEGRYDLTNAGELDSRVGAALARETLVDENDEEYVVEFRKIEWLLRNSKIGRAFNFVNNGDITYSQVKRNRKPNDDIYDYYSKCNVNDTSLNLRFVSNDEELSCIYEGDKRIISYKGVPFVEDTNGIVVNIAGRNNSNLIVNINPMGVVDSKVLSVDNNTYVICNNQVIEATTMVDEEEVSIELTEEIQEYISNYLKENFVDISDATILSFIAKAKSELMNAIKAVKNDVPLKGLARRMDILLTMINAKGKVVETTNKKVKKK